MSAVHPRSPCPVTNALEIFGDKWTLILVRDLFLGKSQYNEFLASSEGITTNILADRLKRLEAAGIIDKNPYQQNPVRYAYRLTEKGRDLMPILAEIAEWSRKHVNGVAMPKLGERMLAAYRREQRRRLLDESD